MSILLKALALVWLLAGIEVAMAGEKDVVLTKAGLPISDKLRTFRRLLFAC